ncbi:porin [Massilia aquatica]|uniref:Porin n=1 Tax=Massilia aquatica TaxID=2609000 RepID=A0ABX0M967_9BURK|nr:porin [Massilia aquatica]NHZ42864.1 porin [Massilia aquatica]
MKPISFAVAILALGAGAAAQAQSSVQIYGLLDAGVDYASDAGAGGKSATRVSSGGMNTSRWGLRGSEDIGAGLKAVWNLEGGVLMDSGGADGALFRRQAYVGLDGKFGRVVLGRSFTSVYDTVIQFDPMGFAPFYSWATSGPATGPSKYGMTTGFDNMVKYSGTSGAFKYGATYGFGEQSSGARDSAKIATAVSYSANGLGLMGTWERVNGNTLAASGRRDETTVIHAGATFETGAFKLYLVGRDYQAEPGNRTLRDVEGKTVWAGVAWKGLPNTTITGAVYKIDVGNVGGGTDADPVLYVARYRYALSKRTDVYVAAAYAKARNARLTGLSRDDAGFADTQRGVITGVQHRF